MPQGWLCVSLWMHDRMAFVRVEHAKTVIDSKNNMLEHCTATKASA
jgi:hypothetical protein